MQAQKALIKWHGDKALWYQLEGWLHDLWYLSEHWHRHMDAEGKRKFLWMRTNEYPWGVTPPKVRVSKASPPDMLSVSSGEASDAELNPVEEEDELGDLCDKTGGDLLGSEAGDSDNESSMASISFKKENKAMGVAVSVHTLLAAVSSIQQPGEVSGLRPTSPIIMTDSLPLGPANVPSIPPLSHQAQRKKRREDLGKACGCWSCYTNKIDAVRHCDSWFEGRVITLIAEYLFICEGPDAKAHHATPLLLQNAHDILDHPEKEDSNRLILAWLHKEIGLIHEMPEKCYWLIPAHVLGHWTLVLIDWDHQHVHFMDSMNERLGVEEDKMRVQEEVWVLMQLIDDGFLKDAWTWVSEQRPQCQTNSYDCGAFVLADMASYMATGMPSQMSQVHMRAWCHEIIGFVDSLPPLVYQKMIINPNAPIIYIDDD
ncbi:hypothetical protein M422DRAFT_258983 [Sphaerobolus stellatus SS14]|uniref:Ubiquitin-like protease family profile domain-containing protein n=1 Tax=Sphaerobolus stellatus (strain SS14) TaxID=990650 RepID=A0A0C9V9Z2_SPHS4|nr:hypothetical protein M422DRAFT_258983 [Sphaerobolus stellatus SS14]